MGKKLNYDNISKMEPLQTPLSLEDATKEAARCLLCEDAPCSKGCPASTDPGKFIRQIRFANHKGAARTIRANNVLGEVCAYTCPTEKLCEEKCTHSKMGDAINISGLQAFACEYGRRNKLENIEAGAANGKRVAVVGAGPAGMSCAAELAQKGYSVTVFEKDNMPGGVAAWGVPAYRLPANAMKSTVAALEALRVEFRFSHAVSSAEALLKDGYDAVFVGAGLPLPVSLKMFEGYDNSVAAFDFLRAVKTGKNNFKLNGKSAVVIGGGAVAMDAAVTAKALGAKRVYAVALEHPGELPANGEELEIARAAGVDIRAGSQIREVAVSGKMVSAVRGVETDWIKPDKLTPDNATPVEGTQFSLNCDLLIQAIGARKGSDLSLSIADDLSTNIQGVFAGGDIAGGAATIAKAVGDGKRAAESIDKYLANAKGAL